MLAETSAQPHRYRPSIRPSSLIVARSRAAIATLCDGRKGHFDSRLRQVDGDNHVEEAFKDMPRCLSKLFVAVLGSSETDALLSHLRISIF